MRNSTTGYHSRSSTHSSTVHKSDNSADIRTNVDNSSKGIIGTVTAAGAVILQGEKRYEELTFTDDFMFCKVMTEHPELCKAVAELITGRKIREVKSLRQQAAIRVHSDGRGIRFDVYFEDDAETMYDIEMQTTYMKAMPKRARYYHSLADSYKFRAGQGYNELPDQYVIFICLNDPFGADLPVYTIRNTCLEDQAVEVRDGIISIFLNASAASKAGPELREFLAYVGGQTADADDSDLVAAIRTAVRNAIDDDEGRIAYMTLLERDQANIEKGFQQGEQKGEQKGMAKFAYKSVENAKMDAASAAEQLGIPLTEFLSGMKAAGFKVPEGGVH